MTVGIIFIVLSLAILLYFAFKGVSVIILAPLCGLFAVLGATLAAGGTPHLLASYTETFMTGCANFVRLYFPVFLLGAIFGKVLEESGSADAIADFFTEKLGSKYAILSVVIACAVLTYGGVSLFVVSFAMYPIGAKLFRDAGINKRILPGTIALGAFTFTMTAIPGTPQVQNAIPMRFLGTTAFAAPVLGIVAAVVMFGLGMLWLTRRAKSMEKKYGPGYGDWVEHLSIVGKEDKPGFAIAIIPIIVTVGANVVFSKFVFPNMDGQYLVDSFSTTMSSVMGTWSLLLALLLSVIVTIVLNFSRLKNYEGGMIKLLGDGAQGSFLAIFNTASENGYGTLISSLAAYTVVAGMITGISSNPLIATAVASSVLAGITGSASGGLTIALSTMGDTLLEMAEANNISPEVLHRVAAVACGGLDTLPHNGAVITLLFVTEMKHRDSYVDIGMNTVVIPLIATAIIIILSGFGIC